MRIAVLALTPVARDARVLRCADALAAAGHEVVVIGRAPVSEGGSFRSVALAPVPGPAVQRLKLVATQAPATLWPAAAGPLYWLPAVRRRLLAEALALAPDIVIANDWVTLPVGRAVKDRTGATLVYDSHEYATQEHAQNWKWRLVSRSAVSAIERRNVASADLVITVSRGIAEALQADYGLPAAPVVVRNMPSYRPTPLRPPNGRRQILFHGLIRPERGLESLIDAIPALSFAGDVVVRGYGLSAYLDSLKARARERGVGDRVVFAPAVGPDHLIERAAEADLGVLLLPGITRHYEFALPNKLFEYLMAGLPVLASPRREIRTLLDEIGAGLFAEPDPGSVAAALNALTEDALIGMRRAALAAARALNWDAEKRLLVGAVEEAHRRRPGRRAG